MSPETFSNDERDMFETFMRFFVFFLHTLIVRGADAPSVALETAVTCKRELAVCSLKFSSTALRTNKKG